MNAISSHDAATVLTPLTQQLHRFFHALDERRYDAMLDMFTDDCRWLRQGQLLEGKAAVRTALESRAADSETRHVMSNSHVAELDEECATVESYMTAYRYPSAQTVTGLPVVPGPLRFNRVSTVFRRDRGYDWRIAEQQLVPAFAFPS